MEVFTVKEWEENYQSLEVEVISLRMDFGNINTEKGINKFFLEGSRNIDQILSSKRPLGNKTSLG